MYVSYSVLSNTRKSSLNKALSKRFRYLKAVVLLSKYEKDKESSWLQIRTIPPILLEIDLKKKIHIMH